MRPRFSALPGSTGSARRTGGWNPLTLAVCAGVWTAAIGNWPLWRVMLALPEAGSLQAYGFMAGMAVAIAALTTILLAPFAWRPTIKPAINVALLIVAICAHFMGTYGVVIDTTMLANTFQTNAGEVRELLSLPFFLSLALLAGVPALALWRTRVTASPVARQAGRNLLGAVAAVLVIAAMAVLLFASLSATMRNHPTMRYLINPANALYGLVDLGLQSQARPAGPPLPIGEDARLLPRPAGSPPPLLLLVVGETARADHFALNGYARPTNPELSTLGVVSFTRVTSCGTNTAASLPCMFSSLGKAGFEARHPQRENLLDLVQRAGLAVLWIDNQAGCKGLCARVPHVNARDPVAGAAPLPPSWCEADECLDEALLHGLDERLAQLPRADRERGVLIVLHQMGSHGPAYYKRSPADRKPFLPECTTNLLQQCESAALVNGYDNSIAYTDHVLASAVRWLQRQSPAFDPTLVYVSDHGESLGENNLYLHGLPYAIAPSEQTHVPMLLWSSARAATDGRLQIDCLRARRDTPLTHDNLFHSTLGVLGIRTAEYQPALDAFAPCRAPG